MKRQELIEKILETKFFKSVPVYDGIEYLVSNDYKVLITISHNIFAMAPLSKEEMDKALKGDAETYKYGNYIMLNDIQSFSAEKEIGFFVGTCYIITINGLQITITE